MEYRKPITYSFPTLLFIMGILGYFAYDGVKGALAVMLIYFVLGLIAIIGIIPFAGIFLYFYLGKLAIAKMLAFTGITQSWVITLALWSHLVTVLVFTILGLFLLSMLGVITWFNRKFPIPKTSPKGIIDWCKAKFDKPEDINGCIKKYSK